MVNIFFASDLQGFRQNSSHSIQRDWYEMPDKNTSHSTKEPVNNLKQ